MAPFEKKTLYEHLLMDSKRKAQQGLKVLDSSVVIHSMQNDSLKDKSKFFQPQMYNSNLPRSIY